VSRAPAHRVPLRSRPRPAEDRAPTALVLRPLPDGGETLFGNSVRHRGTPGASNGWDTTLPSRQSGQSAALSQLRGVRNRGTTSRPSIRRSWI
jgi:hypothetical protein